MKRIERIGDCTLYLGDSRDIVPSLEAHTALIADPPYGVGLGEVVNGQAKGKSQQAYEDFSDTPEYIRDVVVPIVNASLLKCQRGALTPGNRNLFMYPPPADFGVWYNPAGASIGKWGFSLVVTPVLYYGRDPRAGRGSVASSTMGKSNGGVKSKDDHPCPKPLAFMKWLVDKATLEGESVLDPFMGSGTTGIACAVMGRPFTGIEITEKYFDLSCRRIEEAHRQGDFFIARAGDKK